MSLLGNGVIIIVQMQISTFVKKVSKKKFQYCHQIINANDQFVSYHIVQVIVKLIFVLARTKALFVIMHITQLMDLNTTHSIHAWCICMWEISLGFVIMSELQVGASPTWCFFMFFIFTSISIDIQWLVTITHSGIHVSVGWEDSFAI